MKRFKKKVHIALCWNSALELQGVACHIESHIVNSHPTQVNALTPASKLVLDLPTPEGWKAELT